MPFRSVALESRLVLFVCKKPVLCGQTLLAAEASFFASIFEKFPPNFKSIKKEIISFSNPFDTFLSETNLFQN